MSRPSPRLRAALLLALPQQWTTAREIALPLVDRWSQNAIRVELGMLAGEGVVAKRIEETRPNKLVALYRISDSQDEAAA